MTKVANKLLDKLDIEVRNLKIATAFTTLSDHTSLKYSERIKALADEYYLSYKSIERIVKDYLD